MNNTLLRQIMIPVLAIIFTLLFYQEQVAFNLLIFEFIAIGSLWYFQDIDFSRWIVVLLLLGTGISALSVVISFSNFAKAVNYVSYFLLMGILAASELQSIFNVFRQGFFNVYESFQLFFEGLGKTNQLRPKAKLGRWFSIMFLPLGIILIFILIYSAASSYFNQIVTSVTNFVIDGITIFFEHINFTLFILFVSGILISIFSFYRVKRQSILNDDVRYGDDLHRKKQQGNLTILGLKKEYQGGVLLFGTLNVLIFVVNILDVYWVWFKFSRDDHNLKQFVHEGTYLLVLSILISIGLVLYFFKANLNFYRQNRLLKWMAYIWLSQNAFLAVAIGIRNYRYIQFFGIAHKRIGLVFFLGLTLFGLWLVFTKVKETKTYAFIERKFLLATYVAFVVLSLLNWDSFIARYNMNHYETAILDLTFLQTLNDKAVPYLLVNPTKRDAILQAQLNLQDDKESFRKKYRHYLRNIDEQEIRFSNNYQKKGWLSWNWPEYHAFGQLSKK